MNRAECRALGIPKTVASSIEQAERKRTVNTYSTIKKDYATMEDYRIMLREEAGIEIKYC